MKKKKKYTAEPMQNSGSTSPAFPGLRSVQAPETKPQSQQQQQPETPQSLSPGQNICAECERLIV